MGPCLPAAPRRLQTLRHDGACGGDTAAPPRLSESPRLGRRGTRLSRNGSISADGESTSCSGLAGLQAHTLAALGPPGPAGPAGSGGSDSNAAAPAGEGASCPASACGYLRGELWGDLGIIWAADFCCPSDNKTYRRGGWRLK
jgi:hypothetical protein